MSDPRARDPRAGDRIILDRIALSGRHGVLPEEAQRDQRFFVSLDCELDLAEAGRTDDLACTVSYADLAALALEVAGGHRFGLIEALAEAIAGRALARFPRLEAITVRIDKPDAPMPAVVGTVAVVVTRRRVA